MIAVRTLTKEYQLPQSWEELTPEQFAAVADILFSRETNVDAAVPVINALLGWDDDLRKAMKKAGNTDLLPSEVWHKLVPRVQWVFGTKATTKNLIKVLDVEPYLNADKLYGPADNFDNLCIGEFDDAEYWYDIFQQSEYKDLHALDMLIAILYRARRKGASLEHGDPREAYNRDLNEIRAAQIEKLPKGQRLAIFLWYNSCRSELFEGYRFLFTGGSKSKSNMKGWTPIIFELAGKKFGDLDKTNQTPLKTILYELHLQHENIKELKARYPEMFKD
ncbi:MAG: hypothetical protein JSS76_08410 [Bacteroidetes bacterium]|nr:hypothetical protein [Bacteroidota bacterium]